MEWPGILSSISRDTEIYFALIASTHLLILIMFFAARVRFFATALNRTHANRSVRPSSNRCNTLVLRKSSRRVQTGGSPKWPVLIALFFSLVAGDTLCEMPPSLTVNDTELIPRPPVRFIPMMITRMIISLKKVASSRVPQMNLEIPSEFLVHLQDSYSPRPLFEIRLPAVGHERLDDR